MTTGELIAELKRLDPSGKGRVEVPVKSYTSVFPHAYLEPFGVEASPQITYENKEGVGVRIYVSFPKGFRVSEMKKEVA